MSDEGTHWPGCWQSHQACAGLLGVRREHPRCDAPCPLRWQWSSHASCVKPHGHPAPHQDHRLHTWEDR